MFHAPCRRRALKQPSRSGYNIFRQCPCPVIFSGVVNAVGIAPGRGHVMRKEIERLGHYVLRSPDKIGSLLRMVYATKLSSAKGFRRKEFASSLPPLMTIQINNVCNLRCIQCWEWGDNGAYKEVEHKTLKDEMSTEQWETFIEEVSEWRPYLYFFG